MDGISSWLSFVNDRSDDIWEATLQHASITLRVVIIAAESTDAASESVKVSRTLAASTVICDADLAAVGARPYDLVLGSDIVSGSLLLPNRDGWRRL